MGPTKGVSIEAIQRIIKLILEDNPQLSAIKDINCSLSVVTKIWYKYKRYRVIKKGIKNSKQYTLKIEKVKQNKSQYLWQKRKKLAEWNAIYIEKSQEKTNTNIQTEKNEVEVN